MPLWIYFAFGGHVWLGWRGEGHFRSSIVPGQIKDFWFCMNVSCKKKEIISASFLLITLPNRQRATTTEKTIFLWKVFPNSPTDEIGAGHYVNVKRFLGWFVCRFVGNFQSSPTWCISMPIGRPKDIWQAVWDLGSPC